MQFTEAKLSRIFVLRLQNGDRLPESLEAFAAENHVSSALCFLLGGAKQNSVVVVGPGDGDALPVDPVAAILCGVHEVFGVGTIFVNEAGLPKLHMHASFGRGEKSITGCVRLGVEVWRIGEVVVLELAGANACRAVDKETGFELLKTR
jgi:predicted DNA-binding protein with PD1-like motif